MMANGADDSNGYGGGAGGKFRKRPFRKPVTTPYDRPVTALRNTSSNLNNGGSSGWISRIVDPASKLISASAHRLFSSVFRKRLLPPREPAPGPVDNNVESPENHLGDELMDDCSRIQKRDKNEGVAELEQERDKKERETLNCGPVSDGVSELERILNQKTFTRSEIDHLSELLQSRTVEKSCIARQGRNELTPYDPPVGHFRQELDSVFCGNKGNSSEVPGIDSTPAAISKFNDGDIASPAELAKAYMGSRSTAVSSYAFGPRAQALREENHALARYQSDSPIVHTVQKPLRTPINSQNELVIPRSRHQSALYNMARTPYSRVLPTETKSLVTSNSCFTGRSMSASQKVLKRRCSVLENDIGDVGPIRRIRQKSNLSYTKSLGQSSRTPLTHTTSSEVGEASLHSSSKTQEDMGDKSKSISSLHVSSKSIEMGQRILQQLEKMTPPKEKSSDKKSGISGGTLSMESPGNLHGQAYKNLETIDSLKYVQSGQVSGKIMDSLDTVLHRARDLTFEKKDKVHHENGDVKITDNGIMDTSPVVLKPAVSDDARRNGIVSPLTDEGDRSLEAFSLKSNGNLLLENCSLPDSTKVNGSAFPELKSSPNLSPKKNTAVEASTLAEKGIGYSFPTSSILNKAIESSAPSAQSMTTSMSTKPGISASTISFGLSSSDKVSQASLFSSSVLESQLPNSYSDAGNKLPVSITKSIKAVDLLRKSDSTATETSDTDTAGKLTAFGNSSNSSLPGTASTATPSLTNGGFQFGASTTLSSNYQLQASSQNISSQSMFGDQVLPLKTASASTTESIPSQPAASPFSVSFGSSSLAASSSVNQSGSSTFVTASFGSSSILGSSSSGFSAMPASETTYNGSTNIFGCNGQTTSSPAFGSAINNSSSGPSFGAFSASMPSSNASSGFALGTSSISTPPNGSEPSVSFGVSSTSTPAVFAFGASSSSAQSSAPTSTFSFGAPFSTSTTPPASQPLFGNGRSMTAFGSTGSPSSLGNNNQMKMEDTMVEDSMQPSGTSGFPIAPAPASSGANPFQFSSQQNQTPASSGANPFQFSSQQNQTPASSVASPFQFNSQQNQAPASSGASPFQFSSQQNRALASSGANPFQFSSQQNQAPTSSEANPFKFSSQIQTQAPFQFSSQQNQAQPPQNPFQTSDSSGGGSFSLGAGGNDKSNRKIIKVRNRLRKKEFTADLVRGKFCFVSIRV
ncbi:hypothetical protein V2J09_008029 [Rumex salicifolius]